MYLCEQCGKEVYEKFGSGRFCSRSCSNKYVALHQSNEAKARKVEKGKDNLKLRKLKLYKCKCGYETHNSQSYVSHCGHCEIHLGYKPNSRIKNHNSWMKGLTRKTDKRVDKLISERELKLEDILSNKIPCQSNRLKWKLIDKGYKERRCEKCGITEWLENPIPLELHHKDGDKNNNNLDNIEILCPNCHAFTDNYRWKGRKDK